jgi:hypothetical protein
MIDGYRTVNVRADFEFNMTDLAACIRKVFEAINQANYEDGWGIYRVSAIGEIIVHSHSIRGGGWEITVWYKADLGGFIQHKGALR